MLCSLRAKNFILMDELDLSLEPGLNVLTGETGAGKSIVVGALHLVLGGRAQADLVRPGAQETEVTALFDLSDREIARESALGRLQESGVLQGFDLAIRRVVSDQGRSRAYLNGRLCTAGELAELAPELADIASQHESVALTDPSTHLDHLDRFAKLEVAREALAKEVDHIDRLARGLAELRLVEKNRAEREAFLRFQLRAIEEVNPTEGERDLLFAERKRLRHVGKLGDLMQRAQGSLESDGGICDQLTRTAADLRQAVDLDPELAEIEARVAAALSELLDAGAAANSYAQRLDSNPDRLGEIEERLYKLEGLMRQYGPGEDDVLAARARLETELSELVESESRIEAREAEIKRLLPTAERRASELSEKRKAAADSLGAAIGGELAELGMGGARVVVDVEPLPSKQDGTLLRVGDARLTRYGIDRVEFLIAPNKGIEPKPLRKIASGGELSRALLALKRVLADSSPSSLYVFDEVDSGVGGSVAERIGAAIADVASHHQVLCITHLAPIAAFARQHFIVEKSDAQDISASRVVRLSDLEREREVARMLAGAKITEATVLAAREMIAASAAPRKKPKQQPADAPAAAGKNAPAAAGKNAPAAAGKKPTAKPANKRATAEKSR